MSRHQPVIAMAMLAALSCAACHRAGAGDTSAGTVTLVNRVTGNIRCVRGVNCASAVEAALRKRLTSVAIKLRSEAPAVDLDFDEPASAFSSASFREAVGEGGAEVLTIGIEACGTVSNGEGRSWITTGSTRLLLDGPGPFSTGVDICVTGELRDQAEPPRLVTGKFSS